MQTRTLLFQKCDLSTLFPRSFWLCGSANIYCLLTKSLSSHLGVQAILHISVLKRQKKAVHHQYLPELQSAVGHLLRADLLVLPIAFLKKLPIKILLRTCWPFITWRWAVAPESRVGNLCIFGNLPIICGCLEAWVTFKELSREMQKPAVDRPLSESRERSGKLLWEGGRCAIEEEI